MTRGSKLIFSHPAMVSNMSRSPVLAVSSHAFSHGGSGFMKNYLIWSSETSGPQPGELETEIAQSGMVIRTTSKRPMIFTIRFFDRSIIDTRKP